MSNPFQGEETRRAPASQKTQVLPMPANPSARNDPSSTVRLSTIPVLPFPSRSTVWSFGSVGRYAGKL